MTPALAGIIMLLTEIRYREVRKMERDYKALMERDYPEELEPNGFLEQTREHCQYLDKHPEEWKREPKWFREAYKENPEAAILKMTYEFLESFA